MPAAEDVLRNHPEWYHSIELAPGVVTPGRSPLAFWQEELRALRLPSLVGKSVLGGSGSSDSADPSGLTGGLLGAGNPQVAAMKADVLHIATTEETLFTDRQVFVAGTSGKGGLVLGGQSIRLSSSGETVQVVLSPSGVGYCIRAARTPAGGGGPQVVLYVSTQGGLQPPQITSCPAAF